MGLRNIDIDSAIRTVCTVSSEKTSGLLEACAAKMKSLGLKADNGKAVQRAPRHGGRRNPLRGQLKGSGDVNLRGLFDYVESIEPVPELPAVAPEALPESSLPEGTQPTQEQIDAAAAHHAAVTAHDEMQAAHDNLVALHATLVAHQV
jgi:hypothetical protein